MDRHGEPDDVAAGDAGSRPADRLRARASQVDRAARFAQRLAEVQAVRARRRRLRRWARVGLVVALAGVGALVPIVVAAVLQTEDPSGMMVLAAAVVGGVLGGVGPVVLDRLARRRGAIAWDAYLERHVLLGNPSERVRDADRPGTR